MIFNETRLKGAFIIDLERRDDPRGFFARTFCQEEFKKHGLNTQLVQANISFNKKKGTLRGMHYQISPYEEAKLIRCSRGALYDVIIDLRPDSPTYGQWEGVELRGDNYRMFYVPEKFAHGFITLEDNTDASYQVSEFYQPGSERGIRYNDPQFQLKWPTKVEVISDKDANWPDYKEPVVSKNK